MKKLFAIAILATAFVACNNSGDKKPSTDSPAVKMDTPAVKMDTPAVKMDTPAVKIDTPAVKM
jgi:hypothetical protein